MRYIVKAIMSTREKIKDFEKKLQKVLTFSVLKDEYEEHYYSTVSEVVNFIKTNTESIGSDFLKSLIFLIGPTGAGKSTLMNYLHDPKSLVASKMEGKLEVLHNSIAEIGSGKGSTTLFPNIWSSSIGNFLDCAGEGDTGGVIAEVVNSIFKMKISANVKEAKILFVTPYSSLGSEGGYGMSFKNALDKNAQFLTNIDHFRSSIALIISSASVKKNALESAIDLVSTILKEHANLDEYKSTVQHVLNSKNILTFSKPSEELEPGDIYQPPLWNSGQHTEIIKLIENLPFTTVPSKDFFNISTSPDVRETMKKAFKVLEMKSSIFIKDAVESTLPIKLFSVELKPFVKYCGDLMKGANFIFSDYIKILQYNQYFKVKFDKELVNKLNSEMSFLVQFIENNKEGKQIQSANWTKIADITKIFKGIYDDAQSILQLPGNNFLKFTKHGNVETISAISSSNEILANMKLLHGKYLEKAKSEELKNDQTSMYFNEVIKKEFSHTIDVPYKDKETYHDIEYYSEDEEYQTFENYEDKEQRERTVTKFREEKYTENVPVTKTRKEEYQRAVEKFKTEYQQVEETAQVRNFFKQIVTIGIGDTAKNTVTKSVEVPYTSWETATRDVEYTAYEPQEKTKQLPYTDVEYYEVKVQKQKPVMKMKTVQKERPVIKEKEVEKIKKEDVYKDLFVKEFNQKKYDEDIKKFDTDITKYNKFIKDTLSKFVQKSSSSKQEVIISNSPIEMQYEDIRELYQKAEFSSYFLQNSSNSLEELSIEEIGKIVCNDDYY